MEGENKRKFSSNGDEIDMDERPPSKKESYRFNTKSVKSMMYNVDVFAEKEKVEIDLLFEKEQIDLIIAENTYTEAQKKAVFAKFLKIKEAIMSARQVPRQKLSVHIPAPPHGDYINILKQCTFEPPSEIRLSGCYSYNTILNTSDHIDISVLIPQECIEYADRYNQVWLIKKAYYISIITHHLTKLPDKDFVLMYVRPRDNPLDIALDITTSDGALCYRVNFGLHEASIPLDKIYPWTSCVSCEHVGLPARGKETGLKRISTPLYNHTIFTNQYTGDLRTQQLIKTLIRDNTNAYAAARLIRLWAQQRNIGKGWRGVSNFQLMILLVFMIKTKVISDEALPMRMFRIFIEYLANYDWSKPLMMESVKPRLVERHKENSDVVFLAPDGKINYMQPVSRQSAELVSGFAKLTLPLLYDRRNGEQFHLLFILKAIQPYTYYDELITITEVSEIAVRNMDTDLYTDTCRDAATAVIPKLLSVLNQALENKISRIEVLPIQQNSLNPVKRLEKAKADKQLKTFRISLKDSLVLGLKFSHENLEKPVIKGPLAEEEEKAREFQKFWGEKSKLRRFVDGSICEAVVWEAPGPLDRRRIFAATCKYVLKHHFQIKPRNVSFVRHVVDYALRYDSWSVIRHEVVGREEQMSIRTAFEELSGKLKGLKLPRKIVSTQLLSPVSRLTQVFAPFRFKNQEALPYPPFKVMCKLQKDEGWPNSPAAVKALKSIFILTMTDLLGERTQFSEPASKYSNSRRQSNEGRELAVRHNALPTNSTLTISEGPYLFEIMLSGHQDLLPSKHESLLKTQSGRFGGELLIESRYIEILRRVSARFPCYPEVARLLKRWTGVHMISSLIPEVVSDIIACYPLLNPVTNEAPNSAFSAFITILNLLATFNFESRPLMPSFKRTDDDEADPEDQTKVLAAFSSNRPRYPSLAIISEYDKFSNMSKSVAPSTLKLLRETARRSRDKINDIFKSSLAFTWKELEEHVFCAPDPHQFNLLIELIPISERTMIHHLHETYQVSVDSALLFLEHLTRSYGDLALFLYDPSCLHRIGMIWKPGAFDPVPIEKCHENARRVAPDDGINEDLLVQPDIACIQEDITHCGKGIVREIWVNN